MYSNPIFGISHSGLTFIGSRENNEDNLLCLELKNGFWVFAIADGVGGSSHGEQASRQVINGIADYLTSKGAKLPDENQLKNLIFEVFDFAQNYIKHRIDKMPWLAGMKTTLSVLLLWNEKFVCGNIGDSPIFHFSQKRIIQLNTDHTFDKEMDSSRLQGNSLYRNVLTRVVDGGTDIPDIYPQNQPYSIFSKNDRLLLCSDGIFTPKDQNIETYSKIVNGTKTTAEKSLKIVQKAVINKSQDNISIILIEKKNRHQTLFPIKKISIPGFRFGKKKILLLLAFITLLLTLIILIDISGIYHIRNISNKKSMPIDSTEQKNNSKLLPNQKDSTIDASSIPDA